MQRFLALFLLTLLLGCPACFTTGGAKDVPVPPAPAVVPPPPPPVSVEGITPQNARSVLQALAEEMDREQAQSAVDAALAR
jgi:hypothetical protein